MTNEGSSPGAEAVAVPAGDPVVAAHARSRRRAPVRWGCGCLLAGAVLAAIAVAVPLTVLMVYGVLDRRWYERELAYVREAGDPLTLEEMEAYYPTDPAIERTTALWLHAVEGVEDEFAEAQNDLLVRRSRVRAEHSGEPAPPLAGEDLVQAKELVERYRESLDAARAARESGSVARFDVDFERLRLAHNEFIPRLSNLASLLELDAEVCLAENDPEGAVNRVLTILGIGDSLRNEPLFTSALYRGSFVGRAADAAVSIAAHPAVGEDDFVRLQEAFAEVDMPEGFRRVLRGGRFVTLHIVRGESPIDDPDVAAHAKLPFRDADAAKTLEIYRQVAEAADVNLLAVGESMEVAVEEIEGIDDSPLDSRRYPLTREYLSAYDALAAAALHAQARAEVAATAIACERYRRERGQFPAKLADLVPKFLPQVPLDPFDRQPLRYVVDEQGSIVYSVGRNRVDDGGIAPQFVDGRWVDPFEGDLPFRLIERGEKKRGDETNSS